MSKWIFIKFRTSKKLEVIYCLCHFNISHGEPSEEVGLVPCWADLKPTSFNYFQLIGFMQCVQIMHIFHHRVFVFKF